MAARLRDGSAAGRRGRDRRRLAGGQVSRRRCRRRGVGAAGVGAAARRRSDGRRRDPTCRPRAPASAVRTRRCTAAARCCTRPHAPDLLGRGIGLSSTPATSRDRAFLSGRGRQPSTERLRADRPVPPGRRYARATRRRRDTTAAANGCAEPLDRPGWTSCLTDGSSRRDRPRWSQDCRRRCTTSTSSLPTARQLLESVPCCALGRSAGGYCGTTQSRHVSCTRSSPTTRCGHCQSDNPRPNAAPPIRRCRRSPRAAESSPTRSATLVDAAGRRSPTSA